MLTRNADCSRAVAAWKLGGIRQPVVVSVIDMEKFRRVFILTHDPQA